MRYLWKTRIISLLLVVGMVVGMMPMTAFATEGEQETATLAATEVSYKVEHYLQNAEGGYDLDEEATQELSGEAGTSTAAEAKTIEGYIAKEFEQATVAEDGTTVIKIYYDVAAEEESETPAEPVMAGYKVEHYLQNAEGGYDLEKTQDLTGEAGKTTEAAADTVDGYIAREIEQAAVAADGSTVVKVYYDVAAPATAAYTVKHFLQNAEGGYDLDEEETEELTGEVGKTTEAAAKAVEGYEAKEFAQKEIAADGSTVVEIYYDAAIAAFSVSEGGFPSDMTLIQDKESTLAPGITERKVVVYDKNGDRVEMLIATADLDVETVEVYANYKDNQNAVLGMQKTTEQSAAFEKNHEGASVIVAINASYYNTSNGRPTGAFVMEGVDVNGDAGNSYPFLALLKDGTYMIGAKGEYSSYKGQIQEAIGGYIHLVKDGQVCAGLNTTEKYPRQTVGLTADGQLIIMTSDGNQAPKSIGLTVQEQAEVMLALGCVEALHLDGGGSATYCSKQEGSDTLEVINSPSNGSERAVSNTLLLVSTAVPDGTFDHAILTAEHAYITPGSAAAVTAAGVDASGGAAEIPADTSWQLADSTLGAVENGVFTSNGTVGDAVVQMIYNGNVVGSTTVKVVNPDSLNFGRENIIVPYGETVGLALTALYGVNEVAYKASDFEIVLEDPNAGTLEDLSFTAPTADSGIAGTNITVSLASDPAVTVTAALTFGKGSEVVFDFEEGTAGANTDNWIVRTHESKTDWNEQGDVYIVNSTTGRVHSGNQALAFHTDFSQTTCSGSSTTGYHALSLSWNGDAIPVKGAQSIGFWLYIPEDAMSTEISVNMFYTDANGVIQRRTLDAVDDNGEYIYTPYWSTQMEESGWHYVSINTSKLTDDLFIHDEPGYTGGAYKRNFFIKIYAVTGPDTLNFGDHHGDFTYYIDDITVDYSDAVADRELPVFSAAYAYGAGSEKALSYGKTIDIADNNLIFAANVADNTQKSNYTGINAASAKVYVDGNSVGATYANGTISSDNVTLADGYHTIKFEIADNNGNVKTILRSINVNAGSELPTVELVPHDVTLDRLLSGSIYWVDLVGGDIANIETVNAVLNLNSINEWELEHMVVADGFDVSYFSTAAQAAEKDVVLTVKRNGEAVDTSSNVIASIPVRVWDSRIHEYAGHEAKTPEYMWTAGNLQHKEVRVKVSQGLVTFTDDTSSNFGGNIQVDHESYTHYYNMDSAYHAEKGTYHVHAAAAMDDLAATCTEDGYTGRTFCEACNSVVAWGTTNSATGHIYVLTDSILKCSCGALFTGTWTDGKEYTDGVCVNDGWVGDSYYKDGVKLTGIQKVPAPDSDDEFYYDFGQNGVCENKIKYDGLFLDETGNVYRYSKLGVVSSGWFTIENEWYYFDPATMAAATGTFQYTNDITYEFAENGKLTSGCWVKTLYGTRYYYGPSCYENGWAEIDGKTYFFKSFHRLEGYCLALESSSQILTWYNFGDDGVLRDEVIPDGFYTDADNRVSYVKNGVALTGEQVIDGVYYGFNWRGYAQTGEFAGRLYGDDYKAVTGIVEKNDGLCYYADGKPSMAGLIEIDGAYYFASGEGKIVTGKYYVWQGNGILPESTREFGTDGKMLDGIVEKDGGYYYYEMGQPKMAGLIEIDGAYYFAKNGDGELATGEYYVWQGNNILPESTREFGADGKMLEGVVEKDGGYYYYEMGQPKMAGLVYVDDAYYFARGGDGEVVTGQTYYVWKSNDLLPEANYNFGPDGKMRDGIVEIDGGYYYYVNGKPKMAGLIEMDGAYYFAGGDGKIITDRTYYVWQGNGILPESNREFGPDGKMLDGLVERNGSCYYYEMGQPRMAGLVEIDGDYYFAKGSDGEIVTNQVYYVWKGNGIIPESDREFGADGKMLNGLVERDGGYYYYEMGRAKMAGLIEIDGSYYFAKNSAGEIVTNQSYYVWQGNGILPESNYEFGADGKMLDGFVTKEDGIYYYENGKIGTVGLNYIDGYYYFVGTDGKLVTSQKYYVWKTNGLTMAMNYTFDELGRIVF